MDLIIRNRRYALLVVAVLAAFAYLAHAATAQMSPGRPLNRVVLCPNPVTLNLTAPASAPGINNSRPDTPFKYTFAWKMRNKCCQYLSASVTIKYIADQSGGWNDSASGNDLISVAGMPSQHLYPQSGAVAGHAYSMTIPLTATALAALGNTAVVSVEDDTQVTSVTLNLSACCLTNGIST